MPGKFKTIALFFLVLGVVSLLTADYTLAATTTVYIDASQLGMIWVVPFAGILLSLALMPIFAPRLWHSHAGKVAIFWSMAVVIPLTISQGVGVAVHSVLHTYLLEYIPFIILISTLFTISGGIKVQLGYSGTPVTNTVLLCIATFIANWISTTGAAMLFVRPLISINSWCQQKTHIMIFFIILVCNLGGSLTALGDPPLFLGFLNGVSFFWPLTNLMVPFILVVVPVLTLFYLFDSYHYRCEDLTKSSKHDETSISGAFNGVLLLGVMAAVVISGIWRSGIEFEVFHVPVKLENLMRDIILLLLASASVIFTSREIRRYNLFSWEPALEVAKLFAAIFITAIPILAILKIGDEGVLAPLIGLVSTDGIPVNIMYFWVTGGLSAFLDNAPTYLVFFHIAGGDATTLMGPLAKTLTAVSAGAVFMGALTYIGNAPNFMVKSVAEINNIPMPSFFGYLLWSASILLPLFLFMSLIVF